MDIDIFFTHLYELCTKFPVHSTISFVGVVVVSCWYTYRKTKNKALPDDQIKRNQLFMKQLSQIEELIAAKQEVVTRNAFLSEKITEIEDENEEFKIINLRLNQTIHVLERQIETSQKPKVPGNIKKEQVNGSESRTAEELGFDALMEKNFNKALTYFNQAVKINPHNSNTYDYMGIAYTNVSKYDEAIEACQTAIDLNCEDATAFYIMGFAYQKLGFQDKANECFQIRNIISKE